MSVQRTKFETSATELVTWVEYLRLEKEKELNVDKQDLYFAQLTGWVRRSFVKNPETTKDSDFILKFNTGKEEEKEPMTMEEAAAASKSYWLPLIGVKED